MLADRIIGAFTLRRGVYSDVEKDKSFTTTAWFLVLVVAFLNQLGSFASHDIFSWLITTIVSTVFAILGFVVGAVVINFVGRLVFKADVRFDEMVRTLGLAYVWQVVGILGILTTFSNVFSRMFHMVKVVAAIMMAISWLVAAKEALDLEWLQTGIAVVLGWIAQFVITTITAGLVLGLFELVVSSLGSIL